MYSARWLLQTFPLCINFIFLYIFISINKWIYLILLWMVNFFLGLLSRSGNICNYLLYNFAFWKCSVLTSSITHYNWCFQIVPWKFCTQLTVYITHFSLAQEMYHFYKRQHTPTDTNRHQQTSTSSLRILWGISKVHIMPDV